MSSNDATANTKDSAPSARRVSDSKSSGSSLELKMHHIHVIHTDISLIRVLKKALSSPVS